MDSKTKIWVLFPIILICFGMLYAAYIPFKGGLNDYEQVIMDFSPSELTFSPKTASLIKRVLSGPFSFQDVENMDSPDGQWADALAQEDELLQDINYNDVILSLIVVSGESRMAIINGQPVKEGDSLKDVSIHDEDGKVSLETFRINTIEPERVLISGKHTRWIYMKEVR
ncbi:MAG: hypothetical protein ISR96_01940 [Nitrospira sp.]|nr:hypothetical protein [bacterium]MBL7048278.1 hypothetical protein [Nitrospira sp.]